MGISFPAVWSLVSKSKSNPMLSKLRVCGMGMTRRAALANSSCNRKPNNAAYTRTTATTTPKQCNAIVCHGAVSHEVSCTADAAFTVQYVSSTTVVRANAMKRGNLLHGKPWAMLARNADSGVEGGLDVH